MVPLTFVYRRLADYMSLGVHLEILKIEGENVKARFSLLLEAVNMRSCRTLLASGQDGLDPDIDAFRWLAKKGS